MDDWLKTYAVFVTAIAGAIYLAEGSPAVLARQRDGIRALVRGIQQGFSVLSAAGIVIEPRKLALLFALPAVIPETYWRPVAARSSSSLCAPRPRSGEPSTFSAAAGGGNPRDVEAGYFAPGTRRITLPRIGLSW
jgi:hypothetical protein